MPDDLSGRRQHRQLRRRHQGAQHHHGLVYSVAGRNIQTGFIVFSWLGFWGLVMAYRAFRVGIPEGDHRRYRMLLFFLPSLVFWPSSIGKDRLDAAHPGRHVPRCRLADPTLTPLDRRGWLLAGVAGATLLRPHIALPALAPLRRRTRRPPAAAATATHRPAGVVRIAGMAILGLRVDPPAEPARHRVRQRGRPLGRLGDRGARHRRPASPPKEARSSRRRPCRASRTCPMATVSVLFRPFLWEATSAVKAIAGLETALLLGLTVASWKRLRTLPAYLRRNRYVRLRRRVRPDLHRRLLQGGRRGHPRSPADAVPARRCSCSSACRRHDPVARSAGDSGRPVFRGASSDARDAGSWSRRCGGTKVAAPTRTRGGEEAAATGTATAAAAAAAPPAASAPAPAVAAVGAAAAAAAAAAARRWCGIAIGRLVPIRAAELLAGTDEARKRRWPFAMAPVAGAGPRRVWRCCCRRPPPSSPLPLPLPFRVSSEDPMMIGRAAPAPTITGAAAPASTPSRSGSRSGSGLGDAASLLLLLFRARRPLHLPRRRRRRSKNWARPLLLLSLRRLPCPSQRRCRRRQRLRGRPRRRPR